MLLPARVWYRALKTGAPGDVAGFVGQQLVALPANDNLYLRNRLGESIHEFAGMSARPTHLTHRMVRALPRVADAASRALSALCARALSFEMSAGGAHQELIHAHAGIYSKFAPKEVFELLCFDSGWCVVADEL